MNFIPQLSAFVVFSFACSFLIGLYLGSKIEGCSEPTYEILESPEKTEKNSKPSLNPEAYPRSDDLTTLSSKEFACNTRLAFNHLSKLHARRIDLAEHRKRGDANLARIGTINRKSTAAEAAEGAFRGCLSMMMPELLELWDDKNRKGEITARQWDNEKEKKINGITFEVLEQTASKLESSQLSESSI